MKEKFGRMSFAWKISTIFVCLLLALILIFSATLYQYYFRVFERNTIESIKVALTVNAQKMDVLVDTILSAINQVHDNEASYRYEDQQNMSSLAELVISFGTDSSNTTLHDLSSEMAKERNTLNGIFRTAFGSVQGKSSYAILISPQYPIARYQQFYREGIDGVFRANEIKDDPRYQKTLDSKGDLYWFTDGADTNRLYLSKSLRLRDVSYGRGEVWREIGVIRLSFSVDWLIQGVANTEVTEGMATYITDCSGNILWSNDASKEYFSQESFQKLYQALEQEQSTQFTCDKVKYLLQKNELNHGIQIISAVPFSNIQRNARQMIIVIIIITLALAGFGAASVTILSQSMMLPVIQLSKQMKSGHMEKVKEYHNRQDEIGTLYHAYNRQQERIQELLSQVQDSLEKQKQAEIHALQVQMNPHFIYNTLGAISCRALFDGEDEIAQQITALTAIIRYNVKNPDGLVPVQSEFDIIKRYEKIWVSTYGDCLEFQYNIMPECESVPVPKLIIQPLVENAILHGAISEGKKEKILIVGELTSEKWLRVTVENFGAPANVNEINHYLQGIQEMKVSKDSFGLRNVYERIKRYYGEQGNLVYRINSRNHTEAVVEVQSCGQYELAPREASFLQYR